MLLIPRGTKMDKSDEADGSSRLDRVNSQINDRIWKKVARPLAEGVTISEEELSEMRHVVEQEPTSMFVNTLAAAELRAGNLDKAMEACRRSIALVTEGKENGLSYSSDYAMLTLIFLKNENREEAEENYALFEKAFANEKAGQAQRGLTADDHSFAVEVKRALLGSDHLETLLAERDFGLALTQNNQHGTAEKTLSAVILSLEGKLGRQQKDTQLAISYLGYCLRSMDRDAEAIPLLEEAYRFGREDEAFSWLASNLRYAYVQAKKLVEYDQWVTSEYLPTLRKSSAQNVLSLAKAMGEVGEDYYKLDDFEKSEKLLLEASEIAEKNDTSGVDEAKIRSLLGKVYIAAKKYDEAQRQLERVHMSLMEYEWTNPLERSEIMLENLDRLILLYHERMDAAGERRYRSLKQSYEEKMSAR